MVDRIRFHDIPADGVGCGDAGCWRDPLPFVTKTAVMLVSTLAVLFYALAEDVRFLAEGSEGRGVGEGNWDGEPDKVRQNLFGRLLDHDC